MSARLNVLRLRRGRTVGLGMVSVMIFLILGLVFITDEPLVIQVTEDIDFQICPPYCDESFLKIPIPEFEKRIIELTPIITTTDDLGNVVTTRGETTFLQQITGFAITVVGDPKKTFDNGRLKIELELITDAFTDEQISVIGSLESIESSELGGNTATVPFSDIGFTVGGIFVAEILDIRINELVPQSQGSYRYDFVITNIIVDFDLIKFSNETPITIYTIDFVNTVPAEILPIILPLPEICDPQILNNTGICAPLALTLPVDPVPCGNCDLTIFQEEIPPIPEEAIVEDVVPDVPNNPCPDVKIDSISYLFPTTEVSGTTSIWDKTVEGFDIINVDVRNNRNCDLDIALGSKWRPVIGADFISDVSDINILTNQTIPFRSLPFDGDTACAGFACTGQEIQWCFFGQVSTTDPIEVIDEFCGKKFF